MVLEAKLITFKKLTDELTVNFIVLVHVSLTEGNKTGLAPFLKEMNFILYGQRPRLRP